MVRRFIYLTCTHYVTDFGLQSEAMARGKAGQLPECELTPADWLFAHSTINAAGVLFVTGSVRAALFELVAHMAIDKAKSSGMIGFRADQVMHLVCKAIIAGGMNHDRQAKSTRSETIQRAFAG